MAETRKSYEELKAIFAKAGDGIVVGGVYAHYKHPELPAHKVVSVALREEDFEPLVMYEHIEDGSRFVRTKKNFLEEVEVERKKVKRFKLL